MGWEGLAWEKRGLLGQGWKQRKWGGLRKRGGKRHGRGQGRGRGQGQLLPEVWGLPLAPPEEMIRLWPVLNPWVRRIVTLGQLHTPGICHMGQKQVGEVAVGMLVPVDAIPVTVPHCMSEMKVEVQDIEAVIPSQCGAVEIPFNHVSPQRARQGLELRQKETPSDTLP